MKTCLNFYTFHSQACSFDMQWWHNCANTLTVITPTCWYLAFSDANKTCTASTSRKKKPIQVQNYKLISHYNTFVDILKKLSYPKGGTKVHPTDGDIHWVILQWRLSYFGHAISAETCSWQIGKLLLQVKCNNTKCHHVMCSTAPTTVLPIVSLMKNGFITDRLWSSSAK